MPWRPRCATRSIRPLLGDGSADYSDLHGSADYSDLPPDFVRLYERICTITLYCCFIFALFGSWQLLLELVHRDSHVVFPSSESQHVFATPTQESAAAYSAPAARHMWSAENLPNPRLESGACRIHTMSQRIDRRAFTYLQQMSVFALKRLALRLDVTEAEVAGALNKPTGVLMRQALSSLIVSKQSNASTITDLQDMNLISLLRLALEIGDVEKEVADALNKPTQQQMRLALIDLIASKQEDVQSWWFRQVFPSWTVISATQACAGNLEFIFPLQSGWASSLMSCKSRCLRNSKCQAIDFFTKSGWCNTYHNICTKPEATIDGASSYALQGAALGRDFAYVCDPDGLLELETRSALQKLCQQVKLPNVLAVVVVDKIDFHSISSPNTDHTVPQTLDSLMDSFCQELLRRWQLGRGSGANGVLLLISLEWQRAYFKYETSNPLDGAAYRWVINEKVLPDMVAGQLDKTVLNGVQSVVSMLDSVRSCQIYIKEVLPIYLLLASFVVPVAACVMGTPVVSKLLRRAKVVKQRCLL